MKSDSIAIVGAGLVGRLLAWRLARTGQSVALFEKDLLSQSKSAAMTAAGMISPLSELAISEPEIYRMGCESLQQWPEWLEELQQETGLTVPYASEGSLALAHSMDVAELEQFYSDLQYKLGVVHDCEWLDQSGIAKLEPQLAEHFEKGLWLKRESHIDNREMMAVLLKALQALPVTLYEGHAAEIDGNEVLRDGQRHKFDQVVDCRGVGATQLQGIRGVRGEVLHVHCPEIKISRPVRFMHPRYRLYIVPKAGDQYVIGATEIESSDTSPMSVQSMLELGSALYALHPAFAEARVLEMDANLRPSLMDNNPLLAKGEGSLVINGLYRHGYLLAPQVVSTALNLLNNQPYDYQWMVK